MRRGLVISACAFAALLAGAPAASADTGPTITSQGVSGVGTSDATLEATIDPGSAAAGAYYQFQLSESPAELPDELACPPPPTSGPFVGCVGPESDGALPIGHITAAEGSANVSLDLAAAGVTLQPGKTYWFRAVAASAVSTEDTIEWEAPAVAGPAMSFTTQRPPNDLVEASALQPAAVSAPSSSPRHHRHHRHHRHRHLGMALASARIAT